MVSPSLMMECFRVDRVDLASLGVGEVLITRGVVIGDGSTLTIGKEHSIDDIDTVTLLELRNDIEPHRQRFRSMECNPNERRLLCR